MTINDTGLVKYDAMVRAIAVCHAIDEVKDIRDKALALQKYAEVAMNTEAEQMAIKIRLRAERRIGQMLRDRDSIKPGRKPKERSPDVTILSDLGITKNQSSKWQKVAAVAEDDFEAVLNDLSKNPSTAALIRPKPKPTPLTKKEMVPYVAIVAAEHLVKTARTIAADMPIEAFVGGSRMNNKIIGELKWLAGFIEEIRKCI